jgi:hypothetical protein
MVKPGTKERDEAVRAIVQAAVTAWQQLNEANQQKLYLENRQFYGNLLGLSRALSELGVCMDFKAEFQGDLVFVQEYTLTGVEF